MGTDIPPGTWATFTPRWYAQNPSIADQWSTFQVMGRYAHGCFDDMRCRNLDGRVIVVRAVGIIPHAMPDTLTPCP